METAQESAPHAQIIAAAVVITTQTVREPMRALKHPVYHVRLASSQVAAQRTVLVLARQAHATIRAVSTAAAAVVAAM